MNKNAPGPKPFSPAPRTVLLAVVAIAVSLGACGANVDGLFLSPGYASQRQAMIKRIAVVSWAPAGHPKLAALITRVASDRINLRMNYLVYEASEMPRGWCDQCGELEGVLSWRVLDLREEEGEITLHLAAELHDCKTGALLWRAEVEQSGDSVDDDLQGMIDSYRSSLGEQAGRYVVAVFLAVRELLNQLPDPTLNDDEVLEKIELSHIPNPMLASASPH